MQSHSEILEGHRSAFYTLLKGNHWIFFSTLSLRSCIVVAGWFCVKMIASSCCGCMFTFQSSCWHELTYMSIMRWGPVKRAGQPGLYLFQDWAISLHLCTFVPCEHSCFPRRMQHVRRYLGAENALSMHKTCSLNLRLLSFQNCETESVLLQLHIPRCCYSNSEATLRWHHKKSTKDRLKTVTQTRDGPPVFTNDSYPGLLTENRWGEQQFTEVEVEMNNRQEILNLMLNFSNSQQS